MNDMQCKCDYCQMGSCDCFEICEAEDLKTAYESDDGWCYWGDDKSKQIGTKIMICKDCREASIMEAIE